MCANTDLERPSPGRIELEAAVFLGVFSDVGHQLCGVAVYIEGALLLFVCGGGVRTGGCYLIQL